MLPSLYPSLVMGIYRTTKAVRGLYRALAQAIQIRNRRLFPMDLRAARDAACRARSRLPSRCRAPVAKLHEVEVGQPVGNGHHVPNQNHVVFGYLEMNRHALG